LFTGEEDFGMVPLEVNAAGRPGDRLRGGGAMETVIEGVTGIFFDKPTGPLWRMRLRSLKSRLWHQLTLRKHAEKFDRSVFAFRVLQFLASVAPAIVRERTDRRRTLALRQRCRTHMATLGRWRGSVGRQTLLECGDLVTAFVGRDLSRP